MFVCLSRFCFFLDALEAQPAEGRHVPSDNDDNVDDDDNDDYGDDDDNEDNVCVREGKSGSQ